MPTRLYIFLFRFTFSFRRIKKERRNKAQAAIEIYLIYPILKAENKIKEIIKRLQCCTIREIQELFAKRTIIRI